MNQQRGALSKSKKIAMVVAVVLIITVAFAFGVYHWRQSEKKAEKINQGIAYLESLEKQDLEAISKKIDAVKAEQSLTLANQDENAVWKGFDSTMIVGDSRAVGFQYYEFLSENQVIAEKGRKITDVPDDLEKIKKTAPKQLVLCFGLNDIRSEIWKEPAEYAKAYQKVVEILQKELPGTTIYINSILPAIGEGYASYEGYARIGEFNEALKKMAETNKYHYINNDKVAEEHTDLYEGDGLHFQEEFYKYWAINMLSEVSKS